MAKCSKCSREVGCACNLLENLCPACYSSTFGVQETRSTIVKKERYKAPPKENVLPNTEFGIILKTQGLTQQEKLKRINDILEKARN